MNIKLASHLHLLFMTAALLLATASFAQTNTTVHITATSNTENTNGTSIILGGKTIQTIGKLPAVGTQVKDFSLTDIDITEKHWQTSGEIHHHEYLSRREYRRMF